MRWEREIDTGPSNTFLTAKLRMYKLVGIFRRWVYNIEQTIRQPKLISGELRSFSTAGITLQEHHTQAITCLQFKILYARYSYE